MKQLALRLVPLLAFAQIACAGFDDEGAPSEPGLESTELDEGSTQPTSASPADSAEPLIDGFCATRSPGQCSNAPIGEFCGTSPWRWCLPAQELPDGQIFCICQSQSTI